MFLDASQIWGSYAFLKELARPFMSYVFMLLAFLMERKKGGGNQKNINFETVRRIMDTTKSTLLATKGKVLTLDQLQHRHCPFLVLLLC